MARVQTRSQDQWLGLVRVARVRLVVGTHGTAAYVEGTRHRRPVVERVALSRATQLSAAGVPVVLEHRDGA